MKQMTLAAAGFERYAKTTRRAEFLAEMDRVVPWGRLCALVSPVYPQAGNGRPPIELERMIRIHCLQHWFNLSDPAMEESLYDSVSMRRFAGIDLGREPVPDETTVCKFRHLLERHDLGRQIFEEIGRHLQECGFQFAKGTIVDATIISAPSSTKNKEKARDPEMCQTKKGNQWYFGMKVHIGVDKDTGLIHSVETTAANVHDLTPAAELLHGEETVVNADAGYQGIEKRAEMEGKGIGFRVAMRPGKRRALPDTPEGRVDDLIETAKAHIRAKVEHPFRVMKRQFGFQKTRLRGMLKNRCKINVLAALTNLFMTRHQLLCRT